MIFSVLLMCAAIKDGARVEEGPCASSHTRARQLNIAKCNFLDVKRAGWMFIIL